jgi:hypothetical protein
MCQLGVAMVSYDGGLTWPMILTTVSVEVGLSWPTVPKHRIAMRTNAESVSEIDLQSRVNRCVFEVNVPERREFESSHLPNHIGDGLDDLEMFGA